MNGIRKNNSDATLKEISQSTASIFSVDTRKTRRETVSRFVVNAGIKRYICKNQSKTARRIRDVFVLRIREQTFHKEIDAARYFEPPSMPFHVQRFDVEKHLILEFLWESEWENIFLKNKISLYSITWEIIWKNSGYKYILLKEIYIYQENFVINFWFII